MLFRLEYATILIEGFNILKRREVELWKIIKARRQKLEVAT